MNMTSHASITKHSAMNTGKKMKIAIIAITKNGINIAEKIRAGVGGDVYVNSRLLNEADLKNCFPIKTPFKEFIRQIFSSYDGLIFITAAGIATRAIAPVICDKRTDPAVVVVDEQGKFSISLLSGHLGGANELASKVAQVLKCMPVITTASDIQGFESIDVLAKKLGLYIDNFSDLPKVSACLVNGEKLALSVEKGFPYEKLAHLIKRSEVFSHDLPKDAEAAVFVTDEEILPPPVPYVILRPQNTVLGIGTRKGVPYETLLAQVKMALKDFNLSEKSVGCIASVDIKREEKCILQLSEYLNAPLKLYTGVQLAEYENRFPCSSFVKKTVGTGCVARPAAYMASRGGEELGYYTSKGITLAVYKRRTS